MANLSAHKADASTTIDPSIQADEDRTAAAHSMKKAEDKATVDSSALALAAQPSAKSDSKDGRRTEPCGDTVICSVLFMQVVWHSKTSNKDQLYLKEKFNELILKVIKGITLEDIIILHTGDGAAVSFLGDFGDALRTALHLRDAMFAEGAQTRRSMQVRMGINLGPGHLVKDENGHVNIAGDVVDVAQRVMGAAALGQILVSHSYYKAVGRLSQEYDGLFHQQNTHADKHMREHGVYAVGFPDDLSAALAEPEQSASPAVAEQSTPRNGIEEEGTSKPGWLASLFKWVLRSFVSLLQRGAHFFGSLLNTIAGIIHLSIVVIIIVFVVTVLSKLLQYAPTRMDVAAQVQGHGVGFFEAAMQRLEPFLQAVGLGTKDAELEAHDKSGTKKEGHPKAKAQHKNGGLKKNVNKDDVNSSGITPGNTASGTSDRSAPNE